MVRLTKIRDINEELADTGMEIGETIEGIHECNPMVGYKFKVGSSDRTSEVVLLLPNSRFETTGSVYQYEISDLHAGKAGSYYR